MMIYDIFQFQKEGSSFISVVLLKSKLYHIEYFLHVWQPLLPDFPFFTDISWTKGGKTYYEDKGEIQVFDLGLTSSRNDITHTHSFITLSYHNLMTLTII